MKRKHDYVGRWWCAFLILGLAGFRAGAADVNWTGNAGDSLFGTAGNWVFYDDGMPSFKVPDAADHAFFDSGAADAFTVIFDQSHAADRLWIQDDKVTLDLSGEEETGPFNLTLGNNNPGLVVGTADGHESELKIQGGGILGAHGTVVGDASGSTGILEISGSGTTLENFEREIRIGNSGTGTLSVAGGAQAIQTGSSSDRMVFLGYRATGNGTLIVDGNDSKFEIGRDVVIGRAGDGEIIVRNGGEITGGNIWFAGPNGGKGVITIQTGGYAQGNNLWLQNIEIAVESGGVLQSGNTGSFDLAPAKERHSSLGNINNPTAYLTVGSDTEAESQVRVPQTIRLGPSATDSTLSLTAEGHLTVNEGGALLAGIREANSANWRLEINYGGKLTLNGGRVEARHVLAGDAVEFVEEGITRRGELLLTLRDDAVGGTAPIRIHADPRVGGGSNVNDGNVELGSGNLLFSIELGDYVPVVGHTFGVLSYAGTLTGYFHDLAPNSPVATFWHGEYEFELNYGKGTSDVITLTVIPEPHTLGLLLAAGALLALRRRGKRGEL